MLRCIIGLGMLSVISMASMAAGVAGELPVGGSVALGTSRILPWSEPVRIDDPFEGNFVSVFDRHYLYDRFLKRSARLEVQSLWAPQSVRFLLIARDRDCFGQPLHHNTLSSSSCSELNSSRNVIELFIKLGERVFQVSGQNSIFPIDAGLAQALQTAPEQNITIRLVTESGETVDSEIGGETVAAWRTLDVESPSE